MFLAAGQIGFLLVLHHTSPIDVDILRSHFSPVLELCF